MVYWYHIHMFKQISIVIIILVFIIAASWAIGSTWGPEPHGHEPGTPEDHDHDAHDSNIEADENTEPEAEDKLPPGVGDGEPDPRPDVATVVSNLTIPWDIAFLPDQSMLVTERPGNVLHIPVTGDIKRIPIERAEHEGEGGLLGIALHPEFSDNRLLYLYLTAENESGGGLINRVVRYTFKDGNLTQDRVIIDNIPGAQYHDGGRMEFGPPTACASGQANCKLYITAGDATNDDEAQDRSTLNGNILRINPDGSIPSDNPFGASPVYSYGHRNPQGLAWDADGRLWSTEHGRSGLRSGMDELNLITPGQNYGWPDIEGDENRQGMETPKAHSGPDITWAPASAAYWDGSIFFGGLRGAALYEAVLDGERVTEVKTHFKNRFGRIRTIRLGPEGHFYLTTSNRDGRGNPASNDDRIIRVNPEMFR